MKVAIRPVEDADLDVLFEHQSDPVAREMAVFPARDREAFMAQWQRITTDPELYARAVVVDGGVAGNVVSWIGDGRRLVGYWIGREFWGRGVATDALLLALEEIEDRPVFAFVADSNVGSRRVLQKAGFVVATHDSPHPGPDGVMEWLYRLD